MSTNPFAAKGIWLDRRTSLPGFGIAPVTTLADMLADGGFRTVYYHVTNGVNELNVQTNWWPPALFDPKYQPNTRPDIIQALHAKGINVIGWGVCYGVDPYAEGKIAAEMVKKYGLDGWVFDIEESFDLRAGAVTNVVKLVTAFKSLSAVPTGYCSWPLFTNAHPIEVAKAGMQLCDVGIPMAYYMNKELSQSASAAIQMAETAAREWKPVTNKPLVMAGRAFKENGYTTTVDGILKFDQRSRELGSVGSAFWFIDHAQPAKQADWWGALKSTPQFETVAPPRRCPTCGQVWPLG